MRTQHHPVIVIGAGQAGLSMSYCLHERGIAHVVLEKHRVAHAWRSQRWDSFCLVTPNWQCRLPGHAYAGDQPDGFMRKDEIVQYVESYAAAFGPDIREGVDVQRLFQESPGSRWRLLTSQGELAAEQVVVATGGYHTAKTPPFAAALPRDVVQLHASSYRAASALPPGPVLVVGSGQSGCQIAEDLHLAGREVHLCVGSAPRVARRYRGKDVVFWLERMGHYDLPVDRHPEREGVRKRANHYVTGRDGGRDIDLRRFALEGMQLHGRLTAITQHGFEFGDDLAQKLDQADATCERIKDNVDAVIAREGLLAPEEARYVPVWRPSAPRRTLGHEETRFGSVIWCLGFALDYGWLEAHVFDDHGSPKHTRGVTGVSGLCFLGLPWLYTWGSGRFCGVGRDASFLADQVAARLRATSNAGFSSSRRPAADSR